MYVSNTLIPTIQTQLFTHTQSRKQRDNITTHNIWCLKRFKPRYIE